MPVAVMQEWPASGHDTTTYDELGRRMRVDEDPPEGLICHTAGTTRSGTFLIFDVWEAADAWESFRDGRLAPAVQSLTSTLPPEAQAASGPPTVSVYELHGLIRP